MSTTKKSFAQIISFVITAVMLFSLFTIFPTSTVSAAYPAVSNSNYIKAFTISLQNNTPSYGNKNTNDRIGTIYATDELYIYSIDDSWIYCSYPTANGRKYAYIPTSVVTSGKTSGHIDGTATAQITTYRRASTADAYGYVSPNDKVTKIAQNGNYVQLIYPVSGGWKMGWITLGNYNNYIKSNSAPTTVTMPTNTSGYKGYAINKVSGVSLSQGIHDVDNGIDIAAPVGTPVYAIEDGTLTYYVSYIKAYRDGQNYYVSYGSYAKLVTNSGKIVLYAHLSAFDKAARPSYINKYTANSISYLSASNASSYGQFYSGVVISRVNVQKGDKIGATGDCGASTGPHLHFSIIDNGKYATSTSYYKPYVEILN